MRRDNRFEETDKAALNRALLGLRVCPHCRADLRPVAYYQDVWGCTKCRETWHLPIEETK